MSGNNSNTADSLDNVDGCTAAIDCRTEQSYYYTDTYMDTYVHQFFFENVKLFFKNSKPQREVRDIY